MNYLLLIFILCFFINSTNEYLFCPEKSNPPRDIQDDTKFSIKPEKDGIYYNTTKINEKYFYINYTTENLYYSVYESYDYCPKDFEIPTKEDFESLISSLGSDAYSILTNPEGLGMTSSTYYVTRNKTDTFNFYFMHLDGENIKVEDLLSTKLGTKNIRKACILKPPKDAKILFSDGDIKYNSSSQIKVDNKYLSGHLWRINKKFYNESTINPIFTQSGRNRVEYWGKFYTGEQIYLCDFAYVKKKEVSSSQDFSNDNIKKIETEFDMSYITKLHFAHSNSAVSPRIDGGYYVAFSDKEKYLHVLSYDKTDKLIKNFNTEQKAYIQDITSTDYGFALYLLDADNQDYHSYLNLYNKNFELINTVQIMNNKKTDNQTVDSNPTKQIMRYEYNGEPSSGMRFMYRPDNGKWAYSGGRIFLIFCHYNYFLDVGAHTGDTVVTFNDVLKDMDFGITWGASHSLIQSVTFDDYFFWTAALSDAFPEGINVEYTSKREFAQELYNYDPVNKNYPRIAKKDSNLAGYITPYHDGRADGKLGGILYYEKLKLYVLVYAKTPVNINEENNNNIIYATTWKFENNKIISNETHVIKDFGEDNNVMQLRAGKYGDNKLIIIYAPTTIKGNHDYGNVNKGTIPKIFVIELPSFNFIKNDEENTNLLMNTNEDLRTFADGVLIWATSNSDGKLVINKIGTQRLDETYNDINYTLSKEDLKIIKEDNEVTNLNEKSHSLRINSSIPIILYIILSVINLL